jgi:hypothetical protein
MWQTMTGKWIRKYWLWILGVLALIVLGAVSGWKLAALLGVGGVAGSAGKALGEAQKRREIEARQLERERQSLEDRAKDTDQMIDDYYRRKRGG